MKYWLFKTDKECYSLEDLMREQITAWDGVRNYQARNFMREMKKGDMGFFYHSGKEPEIAALIQVVREAYTDLTAFDIENEHYDAKATIDNPIWSMVDVQFVRAFTPPISRKELIKHPELFAMELLKRGSRLSIQKVSLEEYNFILNKLA